jgi:hypothetical protein
MTNGFLSRAVILLAVGVGVAACGSAASVTSASAPAPSTAAGSPSAPAVSASATAVTSSAAKPSASAQAGKSVGFSKALTAWKAADAAPVATMNAYLQQAASDLKAAGNPSYDRVISELVYLAGLPATDLTSAQVAQAKSDEKDLDRFFGTPGLND